MIQLDVLGEGTELANNNVDMAEPSTMIAVIVAKKAVIFFAVIDAQQPFICCAMTHRFQRMIYHLENGFAIAAVFVLLRQKMMMQGAHAAIVQLVQC